jgi:large subunit ribosomal protein L15
MNLHSLTPAEGSTKNRIRIGRGVGSGKGGTATKGHKGGQARTGYSRKVAFEGGQMPLSRRIPKFGFKNPFRVEYTVVNLSRLQELAEDMAVTSLDVDPQFLIANGIVRNLNQPIKILARGEVKVALNITAHKFSEAAQRAIEQAGGKVTRIDA